MIATPRKSRWSIWVVSGALAALAVIALWPRPAAADEALSAAERAALRAEIRAFLLEEPEVIADALAALRTNRVRAIVDEIDALVDAGERILIQGAAKEDADVTLIELTDYNCPYCRAAQPEVAAFLKADPKVRHVVKLLPFIGSDFPERAMIAAQAIGEPEQIAAFHAALMSRPGRLEDAAVLEAAEAAGLDGDKIAFGADDEGVIARLERTVGAARALEIGGTPAFVMGAEVLGGLQTSAQFAAVAAQVRADQAD